jgi:hypothetical protein
MLGVCRIAVVNCLTAIKGMRAFAPPADRIDSAIGAFPFPGPKEKSRQGGNKDQ